MNGVQRRVQLRKLEISVFCLPPAARWCLQAAP